MSRPRCARKCFTNSIPPSRFFQNFMCPSYEAVTRKNVFVQCTNPIWSLSMGGELQINDFGMHCYFIEFFKTELNEYNPCWLADYGKVQIIPCKKPFGFRVSYTAPQSGLSKLGILKKSYLSIQTKYGLKTRCCSEIRQFPVSFIKHQLNWQIF